MHRPRPVHGVSHLNPSHPITADTKSPARNNACQVTPARRETCHTWDKVWALNRQLLEPRAPRHMAVVGPHPVRVRLHGPGTPMQPLAHVQPLKAGHVAHVVRSPDLWLEQQDVQVRGQHAGLHQQLEPSSTCSVCCWCRKC
jgi:hypothetical protein